MSQIVRPVSENGVLRPIEKVDLPKSCEVEVEIPQIKTLQRPALEEVSAILSRRHASGEP